MPRFFKFRPVDAPADFFCEVADGADPADYGIPADAVEVDRLPGDFESHDPVKGWVKDEAGLARFKEDARLRAMSPSERHEDAIEKARGRIMADLAKGKP